MHCWDYMQDEAVEKLVGKIIRYALKDYVRDIDATVLAKKESLLKRNKGKPLSNKQKENLDLFREKLENDKMSAYTFFTKSELFRVTNLDFTYLANHASEVFANDDDDEEDDL